MDQRSPPEFILEAFADPSTVRDVVRGILHTIFFHRFFPSVQPQTREVLDLTLPLVDDVELETMIDQRAAALARQLDAAQSHQHHPSGGGRGQISVQFFEKKRRKTWLAMRGDEEVCWEWWTVKVTVAEPRTESEICTPKSTQHRRPCRARACRYSPTLPSGEHAGGPATTNRAITPSAVHHWSAIAVALVTGLAVVDVSHPATALENSIVPRAMAPTLSNLPSFLTRGVQSGFFIYQRHSSPRPRAQGYQGWSGWYGLQDHERFR
ncbi:hypothetical protein RB595_001284 [Gaeumannomyces hyphopodioides]